MWLSNKRNIVGIRLPLILNIKKKKVFSKLRLNDQINSKLFPQTDLSEGSAAEDFFEIIVAKGAIACS